jgi:hypothetical protein
MEMWYGHDRKISEMMTLEKVFNQICSDYGGHKYSGWIKIGVYRWFTYGAQLRISTRDNGIQDKLGILAYFVRDIYGYQYIFFKLREESDWKLKKNDWVFFYGSEYQKLSFEIILEDTTFLVNQNNKDGIIMVDRKWPLQRFMTEHIESTKEIFFKNVYLMSFCEDLVKRYAIHEVEKVLEVPG